MLASVVSALNQSPDDVDEKRERYLLKFIYVSVLCLLMGCSLGPINISSMHAFKEPIEKVGSNHFIEVMPMVQVDTLWNGNYKIYDNGESKSTYEFMRAPFVFRYFYQYRMFNHSLFAGTNFIAPTFGYQYIASQFIQPKIWCVLSIAGITGGMGFSLQLVDSFTLGTGVGLEGAYAFGNGGLGPRDLEGVDSEKRYIFDATYRLPFWNRAIAVTTQVEYNFEWNQRKLTAGLNLKF